MNNENQIVYVLTNPAMPNLVKIGKTTRSDVTTRMNELYSSGVPFPYECVYAVEVADCTEVEKALHTAFHPNRVNPRREFFEINPEQALAILKLVGGNDVTPMVNDDLNTNVTDAERESAKKAKRLPNINFEEMGIPVGSILVFAGDENAEVTVTSDRKVNFRGEDLFLSKVTRELLGLEYNVQPTRYWTFNGKNLRDIYAETYIENEI